MKTSQKKSNSKDRKDRHHADDHQSEETHEVRRMQPAPKSGKPRKEDE